VAEKRTGFGVDALFPPAKKERQKTAPKQKERPKAKQKQTKKFKQNIPVSRDDRIKTTVELLPETLELIDRIKSQHRREHHKYLSMWRVVDEAVRDLAKRRLG
jgi:hypothetical protein